MLALSLQILQAKLKFWLGKFEKQPIAAIVQSSHVTTNVKAEGLGKERVLYYRTFLMLNLQVFNKKM